MNTTTHRRAHLPACTGRSRARRVTALVAGTVLLTGLTTACQDAAAPPPVPAGAPVTAPSAAATGVPTPATGVPAPADPGGIVESAAPTTLGGDGALDAATYTWFDTFCTGMQPLTDFMQGDAFGDTPTESSMAEQGAVMAEGGRSFIQLAADLGALPAPGFADGTTYADLVVSGIGRMGEVFVQAGDLLSAGNAGWTAIFTDEVFDGGGPLDALDDFEISAELQAGVAAIPSCAQAGMTADW